MSYLLDLLKIVEILCVKRSYLKKSLQINGFVEGKFYGKKPLLGTQYSLTKFGKSILQVIEIITNWEINLGETDGKLIDVEFN